MPILHLLFLQGRMHTKAFLFLQITDWGVFALHKRISSPEMDIISPRAVTGACDHSITCLFSVENCDLFKICCLHHFISFLIIIEYRQLVSILSLVYLSSLTSKHARSYYIDNTLYHTTCRIRQIPSNSHHHK